MSKYKSKQVGVSFLVYFYTFILSYLPTLLPSRYIELRIQAGHFCGRSLRGRQFSVNIVIN